MVNVNNSEWDALMYAAVVGLLKYTETIKPVESIVVVAVSISSVVVDVSEAKSSESSGTTLPRYDVTTTDARVLLGGIPFAKLKLKGPHASAVACIVILPFANFSSIVYSIPTCPIFLITIYRVALIANSESV